MKKFFALALAGIMCAAMLKACGGDDSPTTTERQESTRPTSSADDIPEIELPELSGEYFDAGNVRAIVPEGWKAFPQSDLFSDEEGVMDPDVITICKGGETDLDVLTKPGVRIDYYGPDTQMGGGLKDWYDNTEDLAPIKSGPYTWEGFTTTDYDLMAILVTEDGAHQYQATVYLETDDGTISLEDEDVLAILASVAPSDGSAGIGGYTAEAEEVLADYSWWDDDWYGWWALKNGTGIYESLNEQGFACDAYAEIEVYNDNTGRVTVWDMLTTKDDPMIYAYDITFEEGASEKGRMTSDRVVFFPSGVWNGRTVGTMDEREIGWLVDPAESTVSHFENMIEITGHFESPENPEDSFDYYIYLRPWGMLWDDVREGNTEGCIYSDMMPLNYDDWYISLINLGHERPVSSFNEGAQIINDYIASVESGGTGGSANALDPAAKAGADGKVDMATLKTALAWIKENASYDMPYEEIAA
ncbi:MAG: hypothetical protein IJC39_01350, partial [Firmicutes bacterium]|nr:hypothetical protein [Bacillota bacterium]